MAVDIYPQFIACLWIALTSFQKERANEALLEKLFLLTAPRIDGPSVDVIGDERKVITSDPGSSFYD